MWKTLCRGPKTRPAASPTCRGVPVLVVLLEHRFALVVEHLLRGSIVPILRRSGVS